MTRFTSIGRKRTYVEASFNYDEDGLSQEPPKEADVSVVDEKPPKKKRKRNRKPKGTHEKELAVDGHIDNADSKTRDNEPDTSQQPGKAPKKSKGNRLKDRKLASEQRRLKRITERDVDKTCFACREKGHAVQDCPKIADGTITAPKNGLHGKNDAGVVGICYRCGSRRHRLSQCRERVDSANPLPFASCFVCSGNGHLASSCPQNKDKGVYPNGGCCKLCQKTDHLAKDCNLRNEDVSAKTTVVGTGGSAGADEDDFHMFKRTTREVDREQKNVERLKKMTGTMVGVYSGKALTKPPAKNALAKPKKVVNF